MARLTSRLGLKMSHYRLCLLVVTAGYRWIKSQAWMPDFDTCEPLASLE
jgi:hypothetical protein